jgi:peptide/nickel transport system permease protein
MVDIAASAIMQQPSRWAMGLRRGGARLWVGGAIVAALTLVALFAPWIAPPDPT